ncbi:hypothetical protein H4R34_001722 [Dimargaris verticillata]|uniref:Uncharacterized protein n=1 Tax=Dimargaris verticillata TaxID=2761393 RepID=A0A9W8B7X3_9FUNG|nr:hypothetical protein H4R34_001722 [Dimargaris verticillata]
MAESDLSLHQLAQCLDDAADPAVALANLWTKCQAVFAQQQQQLNDAVAGATKDSRSPHDSPRTTSGKYSPHTKGKKARNKAQVTTRSPPHPSKRRRLELDNLTFQPAEQVEDVRRAGEHLGYLLTQHYQQWADHLIPWTLAGIAQWVSTTTDTLDIEPRWYFSKLPITHMLLTLVTNTLNQLSDTEPSADHGLSLSVPMAQCLRYLFPPTDPHWLSRAGVVSLLLAVASAPLITNLALLILELEAEALRGNQVESQLIAMYAELHGVRTAFPGETSRALLGLLRTYYAYVTRSSLDPAADHPATLRVLLPSLLRPTSTGCGVLFWIGPELLSRWSSAELATLISFESTYGFSITRRDEPAFAELFQQWLTDVITAGPLGPLEYYALYDGLQRLTLYLHQHNGEQCGTSLPPSATAPTSAAVVALPACNRLFSLLVQHCHKLFQQQHLAKVAEPTPSSPPRPAQDIRVLASEFTHHLADILAHWDTHSLCPFAHRQPDPTTCIISESFAFLYLDLMELLGIMGTWRTRNDIVYYIWLILGNTHGWLPLTAQFPLGASFTPLTDPTSPHSVFLLHTHSLGRLFTAFELYSNDYVKLAMGQLLRDIADDPLAYGPEGLVHLTNRLVALSDLCHNASTRDHPLATNLTHILQEACLEHMALLMDLVEFSLAESAMVSVANESTDLTSTMAQLTRPITLVEKLSRVLQANVVTAPAFWTTGRAKVLVQRHVLLYARESALLATIPAAAMGARGQLVRELGSFLVDMGRDDLTFRNLIQDIVDIWFVSAPEQILFQASAVQSVLAIFQRIDIDRLGSSLLDVDPSPPPMAASAAMASDPEPQAWYTRLNGLLMKSRLPNGSSANDGGEDRKHRRSALANSNSSGRGLFAAGMALTRSSDRRRSRHNLFGTFRREVVPPSSVDLTSYWTNAMVGTNGSTSLLTPTVCSPTSARPATVGSLITLLAPRSDKPQGTVDEQREVPRELVQRTFVYWYGYMGLSKGRHRSGPPLFSTASVQLTVHRWLLKVVEQCLGPRESDQYAQRARQVTICLWQQLAALQQFESVTKYEEFLPRPVPFLRDVRRFNRCRQHPMVLQMIRLASADLASLVDCAPILTSTLAGLIGFFHQQHTNPASKFGDELGMVQDLLAVLISAQVLVTPLDRVGELCPRLSSGDVAKVLYGCVWRVFVRKLTALSQTVSPISLARSDGTESRGPPCSHTLFRDMTAVDGMSTTPAEPPVLSLDPAPMAAHPEAAGSSQHASSPSNWDTLRTTLVDRDHLLDQAEVAEMREIVFATVTNNLPHTLPFVSLFV